MPTTLMPGEAADPYCLREGEAAALLAGHPWRRFAVLGDSIAEGLGEPAEGYPDQPWTQRVADELADGRPDFAYHNLGLRDTPSERVRAEQLPRALELRPDLALVACGGFNALHRGYDPQAVRADLLAIAGALREAGAQVITVSMFDGTHNPVLPQEFRELLRPRLLDLAERTREVAARLDTVHVELLGHPATPDADMYAADGRHGTRRSHAIAAAETVRTLGAWLRRPPGDDAPRRPQ
ncbi:SGNH/GDSL hydrolase family protein [Actinacidiphila acididurans]|uniref:SGNH/GDSL hydrolase family protein n=1 Tax=Actinacidiphila acididurans TaxID=2784346 RepID=A0ABS2U2M6_9ACTN|nr:SGNH/GDSL hydrolase family protein [Actinacidiphila acididurans]MBM9509845.1 SGNH/GDSL hydrolase family protein [Actinacidiphila acididurans]